jgi:hypothetical protein
MIKWHYLRGLEFRNEEWVGRGYYDTYRAKVPGGWLVVGTLNGETGGTTPTFVPDPEHKWDGRSLDYDPKVDG